jgi:predicted esterase
MRRFPELPRRIRAWLVPPTLVLLAAPLLAQEEYGTTYRLKVDVGGEERKIGLFVPNGIKKGEVFPLLVALPDTKGKAFLELGQWQQPAFEKRFCVLSVDLVTSGEKGWHPTEQLEMQRDGEAVVEAVRVAREEAQRAGVQIDEAATVLTGFSGGTYCTLWLGIRRPDLFMAVCGRSCVFYPEELDFSKFEKVAPDKGMRVFLYHGELDNPRVKKETELAKKTLEGAGFTNVSHSVIPGMAHESKPEVFLEWYVKLLKESEKGRKEGYKIKAETEKIRADIITGRGGAYGRLQKLVERERKAGAIGGGAAVLLDEVLAEAKKKMAAAENLEADNHFGDAEEEFSKIEKEYMPLDIAKEARERRIKLINSDAYKAADLLAKAKRYLEKGERDRAVPVLEKIVDQYGETPAAEEARLLLTG